MILDTVLEGAREIDPRIRGARSGATGNLYLQIINGRKYATVEILGESVPEEMTRQAALEIGRMQGRKLVEAFDSTA